MSKFKIVFIDKFYHTSLYMGNIRQHFDSKKFARQYFNSIKEVEILKWKRCCESSCAIWQDTASGSKD